MTSKDKSIRNQEEENGSMHGFECRGDGVLQESISSDIEPWGITQEVGGITWIYDGKVKEEISVNSMQLANEAYVHPYSMLDIGYARQVWG